MYFSVKAPGNQSTLMTLEDQKILSLMLKPCSVLPSVSCLRKRKISPRVTIIPPKCIHFECRQTFSRCLSNGTNSFFVFTAMEKEDMHREEEAEKMEQKDNIVNSNIRNMFIFYHGVDM